MCVRLLSWAWRVLGAIWRENGDFVCRGNDGVESGVIVFKVLLIVDLVLKFC